MSKISIANSSEIILKEALTKYIAEHEAKDLIQDYKKESIENFKNKLIDKFLDIEPDTVAVIRCSDGEYRNRPLIDFANICRFIEELAKDEVSIYE